MNASFSKYHGLGNNFVLAAAAPRWHDRDVVAQICDANTGVGADGVITYERAGDAWRMVIINQDGSRPEMCGNGVRCLVAMLLDDGLVDAESARREGVEILSDAGPRVCRVTPGEGGVWLVEVDMGAAQLGEEHREAELLGYAMRWRDVDMGNPHAVVFEMPDDDVIDAVGALVHNGHALFEHGVNVEFCAVIAADEIEVVVFERGVGRTQACGTGACAVAAAAWADGVMPDGQPVSVRLPGGPLQIRRAESGAVLMQGPAVRVFSGALAAPFVSTLAGER